jgi:hypothetical protein
MSKRALRKDEFKKLMEHFNQPGHKRPVTRRDFLSAGVIPFSAWMAAPSLITLLARTEASAQALNCPQPAQVSLVPFVHVNLSGGAALHANWVPRDRMGVPLASYDRMGMGTSPTLTQDFGGATFYNNDPAAAGLHSFFYEGLTRNGAAVNMQPSTVANTLFVGLCNKSNDDTSSNTLSALGMVSRAGLVGSVLPNLGTVDSMTGVRQRFAKIQPPSPVIVKRFGDISGALGLTGIFTDATRGLSALQRQKLMGLVNSLNDTQLRRLASLTDGPKVENLMKCAGIKNSDLITNGTSQPTDIRTQAAPLLALWGITAASNDQTREVFFGSMVLNCLNGNSGPIALELGGYDYHDNTRTTGDTRDLQAGVLVGRIIETAALLNRPIFVHVTTDGSVRSPVTATPGAEWSSDRGEAGVQYMIMYQPSGRPVLQPNTSGLTLAQIGHFNSAQAVDTSTAVGGSTENAAAAAFLNWLKMSTGNLNIAAQVFPGGTLNAALTTADVVRI